jgi:hypothetical protein
MSSSFEYPSVDALLADARASAGLDDFGEESFKQGLRRFLDGLREEVSLSDAAATGQVAALKRRLVNRLEVEEWYRTHPEVEEVRVGPSVSITGLPRTGTTALVNILSLDDQFRLLRSWEQSKPCPPPVLGEEDRDPRRLAALAAHERMTREQPEMMALHLWDPNTTEEDVELLGMAFGGQQLTLPIWNYRRWWREADLRPAFAYHRRVIKLLQSRRPPDRWLFKAPAHNFHLDALLDAYPDARVIITHRDPARSVPSAISFVSAVQLQELKIDPHEFGREHAEQLRTSAERSIAARARLGQERFLDVHHRDFVRDPFGVLKRVYAFLGQELTPGTLAKMEAWHAENRSGAHGAHRYTAEQFGLNTDRIREEFDFYIKQYDVPLEG